MTIAEQARALYERDFKPQLEAEHRDEYIAIEPVTKRFFLGDTFIDAALAAKAACPENKSFVIRIGHDAAFHIGSSTL